MPVTESCAKVCFSKASHASSPAPNFRLKLKLQTKIIGGGDLSKKLNLGGGAKFKEGPKILGGGSMNPNDVMVVVLKDIILC